MSSLPTGAPSMADPRVGIVRVSPSAYEEGDSLSPMASALTALAELLGWNVAGRGALGALIPRGSRVLVKPNWVMHENQGPWGIEPLVTHGSLIRQVVTSALEADPVRVLVGDAPVQGCDFDQFVLFDLGSESLLEPITDDSGSFRVTMYPPSLMRRTHAPGRHQYLVARDVMDADVILNLPKLKTHKKAGITCALKNLIGINGNKEYLPHHRLGGANLGGDCYPGDSKLKRMLEYTADRQNTSDSPSVEKAWGVVATQLNRMLHLMGDNLGIEGSWSGNDTIWRTGLDLNRILLYGKLDGGMAATPRRRVVHIVDAIVAGQGDGPLSPLPLPLGLLLVGDNAACVDWFGAQLLGYDPQLISIVRE